MPFRFRWAWSLYDVLQALSRVTDVDSCKVKDDVLDCGEYQAWIDEDENKLYIETADADNEIPTPEAMSQHDSIPDFEDAYEEARELDPKAVSEAEKECQGDRECLMERIYEILGEALNREADKEINEWESKPAREVEIAGIKVKVKPVVVERYCPINIPHYHYYKGYLCEIPLDDVPNHDVLAEIASYCLSPDPYSRAG